MAAKQDQDPVEDANPRRFLPENSVEYHLFLLNGPAGGRSRLAELESLRQSATSLSQALTKDYIWQRDEFSLNLENEEGLMYLHGLTDYGDSVEDEWLIVYILKELTKSNPNLWARISDADGEFLLIEAANVVPKWLNPEIDANRAWIHRGQLRIIPLEAESKQRPQRISLSEAVDVIRKRSESLVHSPFIEAEALYRTDKYPRQVEDSLHHSLVTIPRKLAYILHSLPKSIAPATEAFYLRDPIDLKSLNVPSTSLRFPPRDMVTTSVRFSKVLFAQLRSQQFEAPTAWQSLLQKLPGPDSSDEEKSRDFLRLETGMKLACGFELAAKGAATSKSRVLRELALLLEDLEEDGDDILPTDEVMNQWRDAKRDDDESWLDINYEDFERELEGKRSAASGGKKAGFGDAQTHADLRKIVSRFEAFLNDDRAGLDGAELEDMDEDDDDDEYDDTEEDSEAEDKEVSFDEDQFSRMMQEMMGLPPRPQPQRAGDKGKSKATIPTKGTSDLDLDEDAQIKDLSSQMEAELNRYGALKLDKPSRQPRLKAEDGDDENEKPGLSKSAAGEENEDEDSDEQVDVDYNLAKNILESFKSQGGMSGPTGNLLGMMGLQLPRDEDDEQNE